MQTALIVPGSRLLLPDGRIEVVRHLDLMRDVIETVSGARYYAEEIEDLEEPDLADTRSLETWLAVDARVLPSRGIELRTHRCDVTCDCRHCYRNAQVEVDSRGNEVSVVRSFHMKDDDTCQCVAKGCDCAG